MGEGQELRQQAPVVVKVGVRGPIPYSSMGDTGYKIQETRNKIQDRGNEYRMQQSLQNEMQEQGYKGYRMQVTKLSLTAWWPRRGRRINTAFPPNFY